MNNKYYQIAVIIPVMFSFLVMGFVDIVGVVINYLTAEFPETSKTLISLLTSSCFLWFLVFSIPAGLMTNRIGRKKTVMVSLLTTAAAFGLVTIHYSITTIFTAFSLAGIGCTLLEVSLFPLCTDIVSKEKITVTTIMGQLARTFSCLLGPILVNWLAIGGIFTWKAIFPIYAVCATLGLIWLGLTPITETKPDTTVKSNFRTTISLFADKSILLLFIGMLVLIGIDVGINTAFPQYLRQRFDIPLDSASLGNSIYFLSRIIGSIAGSILLIKCSERKIYIGSIITVLIGMAGMILAPNTTTVCTFVFILGLGYSNIFALLFSSAMKRNLSRSNDISSLMVMGISGGAILPPVMALSAQITGHQWTAILIMSVVWIYMFTLTKRI